MTITSGGEELATLCRLLTSTDGRTIPRATVPWARAGAGPLALAQHSVRRERVAAAARLAAIRARRPLVVVRPVRGSLREGLRDRVRRSAGSGYVACLPAAAGNSPPSNLDAVLRDIGGSLDGPLAVGADGAVRATMRRTGTRVLVRIGLSGTPADPSHARNGLQLLASMSCEQAPPLLASGERSGITWVVEGLLPGRKPHGLSATVVDQVAAFLAALPPAGRPAELLEDAAVLARAVPDAAEVVLAAARAVGKSVPGAQGQMCHGDLWAGNLLTVDGRLTGVVDWDAWTPAGVPGVDLLHLIATETRIHARLALGDVWLLRPWETQAFIGSVRRHWPSWADDAEARAAVGVAWWLAQLAGDLRRNPGLARETEWVQRNITAVTDALRGHDFARHDGKRQSG